MCHSRENGATGRRLCKRGVLATKTVALSLVAGVAVGWQRLRRIRAGAKERASGPPVVNSIHGWRWRLPGATMRWQRTRCCSTDSERQAAVSSQSSKGSCFSGRVSAVYGTL